MPDPVVFMYLGELIEVGATEEMFQRLKNPLAIDDIAGHFG